MSNRLYSATVEALETVLSPRVVSRTLQEGLREAGETPDSVEIGDLEGILKGPVYRRLQVTMPVTKAKETVSDLFERLQEIAEEDGEADTNATAPVADRAPDPATAPATEDALGATEAERSETAATPAEARPGGERAEGEDSADDAQEDAREAVEATSSERQGLAAQSDTLGEIREAMRPFNLFFEWPEVQKLRAQVRLLASEQEAEREAPGLVDQARNQLRVVEQKLEDQLVIQARELGELEEALEQVRTLGGPKVRRLESLLGQIGSAQERRQLAPAEIERARRVTRDLRKLMESSVYVETESDLAGDDEGGEPVLSSGATSDAAERPTGAEPLEATPPEPTGDDVDEDGGGVLAVDSGEEDLLEIDRSNLDPEVSARLLQIDVESERADLDALIEVSANLLRFRPEYRDRAQELSARLDADESVAEEIEALASELANAEERVIAELRDELRAMERDLEAARESTDVSELAQSLTVSLGILETTLPNAADIEHVRRLHAQTLESAETRQRMEREAEAHLRDRRDEQAALLERLEATLLRYDDESGAANEVADLSRRVERLREAQGDDALAAEAVAEARRAEEALESAVARNAESESERRRAGIRSLLAQIDGLPAQTPETRERIAAVRGELERQLGTLEGEGGPSDADVATAESLVRDLKQSVRADFRTRLDALASRASAIGNERLLDRLRRANDDIDDDLFPDLTKLRNAVDRAVDAHRTTQRETLRDYERRAARFTGTGLDELAAVETEIEQARADLDEEGTVADLAPVERALERLEATVATRLEALEPRLDAALERFGPVAKLNSDDVATVRRILRHLDSQRESFDRVSVGLQLQLEASLSEAETLLDKLQGDYETTREIADRLVASNVLDDVLGLFGGDADEDTDEEEEGAERAEPGGAG